MVSEYNLKSKFKGKISLVFTAPIMDPIHDSRGGSWEISTAVVGESPTTGRGLAASPGVDATARLLSQASAELAAEQVYRL